MQHIFYTNHTEAVRNTQTLGRKPTKSSENLHAISFDCPMTHKIRPVVSHNLPDASHYVNAPSIKSLCNAWRDFIFCGNFPVYYYSFANTNVTFLVHFFYKNIKRKCVFVALKVMPSKMGRTITRFLEYLFTNCLHNKEQ